MDMNILPGCPRPLTLGLSTLRAFRALRLFTVYNTTSPLSLLLILYFSFVLVYIPLYNNAFFITYYFIFFPHIFFYLSKTFLKSFFKNGPFGPAFCILLLILLLLNRQYIDTAPGAQRAEDGFVLPERLAWLCCWAKVGRKVLHLRSRRASAGAPPLRRGASLYTVTNSSWEAARWRLELSWGVLQFCSFAPARDAIHSSP